MNSSFMQILRKNNIDFSTNMAVFLRGCKPIFFIRIAGHTEVFSGFLICIDLKKKKKQSKPENRSDRSQQHHKKGHASFLYYFKNKEYNIITQENSNGWIYFNRTNKTSNLKNWDSFALVRIFLFLFLLLLLLFLFFFAFLRLSKTNKTKSISLFHNKLIFHSNPVFFSHYLLSKVIYNQRVRGVYVKNTASEFNNN